MEKIIVTSESQLNELISKSVNLEFRRVLLELGENRKTETNQKSKFGHIDWFRETHPKKPAKATVYSNIYNGKIPKYLIYKPEGSKQVLFFKELVLQWINDGFPSESQLNNIKDGNSKK